LELNNLTTFYWVVKLRSFSKAATKLNISKGAITHRIMALEKEVQYSIIAESTEVVLTQKGEFLYEMISKMLEGYNVEKFVERMKKKSILNIGIATNFASKDCRKILNTLSDEVWDIRFYFDTEFNLREKLIVQDIDCLLYGWNPQLVYEFEAIEFQSFKWLLVAPKGFDKNQPYNMMSINPNHLSRFKKGLGMLKKEFNLKPVLELEIGKDYIPSVAEFVASNDIALVNSKSFEREIERGDISVLGFLAEDCKYIYFRKNLNSKVKRIIYKLQESVE